MKKGEQDHLQIIEEQEEGDDDDDEENREEKEDPADLLIVRPDQNMDCVTTSISASTSSCSRFRQEEEDVSSLKDYELDEKIEKYRMLIFTMKMRDDNKKLRLRLQVLENEKQRRNEVCFVCKKREKEKEREREQGSNG